MPALNSKSRISSSAASNCPRVGRLAGSTIVAPPAARALIASCIKASTRASNPKKFRITPIRMPTSASSFRNSV